MSLLEELGSLDLTEVSEFVADLDEGERYYILQQLYDWEEAFARPEQCEPTGDWRVWLINAGRGFGKTRSGAEWVRKIIESGRGRRGALVARTAADARDVMVEGESGLLAVCPPWYYPEWRPSKRKLTWPREPAIGFGRIAVGPAPAECHTYSAEDPDVLRGPQHDFAWCDELASWNSKGAWDMLMLGLRLGADPRCCVTTTPKPTRLIKQLVKRPTTVITGGSTYENIANLAPAFIEEIIQQYEGTSLGSQELYAVLLEEAEGALWKRAWIETNRVADHPDLSVLVVAVDPAVTNTDDSSETGIVIAGQAWIDGLDHYYVVDDRSGRFSPDGWASRAIESLDEWAGDYILGEVNNGGDLVSFTVKTVDPSAEFREVRASRGKRPRAEPVSALYEQGRVHHVGVFTDLEDQLCQWEPGSGADSPDRLDALVWAIMKMRPKKRPTPKKLDGLAGLGKSSYWREIN